MDSKEKSEARAIGEKMAKEVASKLTLDLRIPSISYAMQFLNAIWNGGQEPKPFSEPRLRAAMDDALELAIKAGLIFDLDDFSHLYDNFHMGSGYYVDSYLWCNEKYYTVAVANENISACQSFEKAVGRKPFITDNVALPNYHYAGHFDGIKKRSRLTLGAEFQWSGEKVKVSSFAKDNSYVVACSYKSREKKAPCPICHSGGWETGELKVKHLYKITHKDLRAKTV